MSRINRAKSRRTVDTVSTYSAVPSRKIRKEKKKAIAQSIIMIAVAIILFFAFIFVIIPGFFNLFTNFLDSSSPFQETDTIPPQIPIVSAPISATNSAQLKVTGFGEPESFVIFVLNGSKQEKVKIATDGSFEVPITLTEGENVLRAYGVDDAQNESATTKDYVTLFDTTAPILEITEPTDGTKFESRANESVTIQGKTDDGETGTRIYINDRVVFPKDDGTFSYTYRLSEGENKLQIKALDRAGNSSELEITYFFSL